MDRALVRMSKFLSYVLRHHPEQIGLKVDDAGWADVRDLLERATASGVQIDRTSLEQVVEQNDKQRFAFSADGSRIRASQGHSIPVDLRLEPMTPPDRLYHGTAPQSLAGIREAGLLARGRNHVHLSLDPTTARSVGSRHGRPVILIIDARRMMDAGYSFFQSANGVWLTESVPAEYITFP